MKHLALLLAFACAFPVFAQEPAPATPAAKTQQKPFKKIADVPYVTDGHARQKLDLYLPEQSTGPRPLVVWIHGGGWAAGSKNGLPAADGLIKSGYVCASVEYRFSQDAKYPAQIEDCKAAIRWLRAHAAEYGIDPKRVGVWGASAGGHLVALLGTTGNLRDFDVGENLDQSSSVQCVLDWFGPTDFLHWGNDNASINRPDSLVSKLLGAPADQKPEPAHRASPIEFVTAQSAPFLIMHGDEDPIVPLQQSQDFAAALKKAGVACELVTIAGEKHGGPGFLGPDKILKMAAFLGEYLQPGKPQ